jgi:hypothetical protein
LKALDADPKNLKPEGRAAVVVKFPLQQKRCMILHKRWQGV